MHFPVVIIFDSKKPKTAKVNKIPSIAKRCPVGKQKEASDCHIHFELHDHRLITPIFSAIKMIFT